MTCSTLSTSTASCRHASRFRSACTTQLATLRCTNTSPGISPVISDAGTRESEQPIHMYLGFCCWDNAAKKPGYCRSTDLAQRRLFSKRKDSSEEVVALGWWEGWREV